MLPLFLPSDSTQIFPPCNLTTFQPTNKYLHKYPWSSKEEMDLMISSTEKTIENFLKTNGMLTNDSLYIFLSWMFTKFVRKIFNRSGSCYSDSKRRNLFKENSDYTFWELITYYENKEVEGVISPKFFYPIFIEIIDY